MPPTGWGKGGEGIEVVLYWVSTGMSLPLLPLTSSLGSSQ